ncbi:sugar lactone lactonase YvrE [Sinobacterium caligoides]|uniref:Sugar lactone lactonase YvrE n=1 Tax=Sinobacterium caligoides TaxID=933926 RepID=A0A3N2DYY7_9GAMM|nr:SMP-30/gluconolactonase/LRE family protein [Sinobacterium caligoides]ROS05063.1 sugar lactone lactonase YvrE [Sinobacterium caligoides]
MIKEESTDTVVVDHPTTIVAEGLTFPEAPRWHDGALYFSDFYSHSVYCLKGEQLNLVVEVAGRPSGLGWLPNGDMLVVSMCDQRVLRFDGEQLNEFADVSDVMMGPLNDMVVTTQGQAYVGSFGFEIGEPIQASKLVKLEHNGAFEVVAEEMTFPNGSVLLDGGKVLVVAETLGHCLTAFDVGDDGLLSGRRLWADLGEVMPDGIASDGCGGIWVATVDCYVLRVLEGGQISHRIALSQKSFACVLDAAGDFLYICTSAELEPEACQLARSGRIERFDLRSLSEKLVLK